MASFVREVLSATGTLGDKEHFSEKISKIQKKLLDLKSALLNHIDNRYRNFAVNLNDASSLTSQMETMLVEVETLNNNINNQMKTQLGHCSKELTQLNTQMEELNLTLQVVEKLKTCYVSIEFGNECLRDCRWLEAAESIHKTLTLMRSRTCFVNESELNIVPAIKQELLMQQEMLLAKIDQDWGENVVFGMKEERGEVVQTMTIGFEDKNGEFDKSRVEQVVKTMFLVETLDEKLGHLGRCLQTHFFGPILSHPCSISVSTNAATLRYVKSETSSEADTCSVLTNIRHIFSFVSGTLDVPAGDGETLLAVLGRQLGGDLSDRLVRDCLAPAVPATPAQLPDYGAVIQQTEELHQYLVDIGLLPASNDTILNYARNVDTLFANKVCQNILSEAREIMKEDMTLTVVVTPEMVNNLDMSNKTPANKSDKTQEVKVKAEIVQQDKDVVSPDLHIPPNFPLPSATFQFPTCSVSSSVLSLMKLAHRGLTDACAADPFCAVRLFHTVRNVFEMWCAVTPTYHRASLDSLPGLAAVAHNNAMYLAHQLVTLGFLYRDQLPVQLQQHSLTFTDLVPRLRDVGANVLLATLRKQRDVVKQILAGAGFATLSSDRRVATGAEQAIKNFLVHLVHLQKVWQPCLPISVYAKTMGTLVNSGLEDLIQHISSLEDISADTAEQLVSLLKQLVQKTPAVFGPVQGTGSDGKGASPHDVVRYVRRWAKFKELILVLSSSLREIDDRWSGGQGPLATEFQPEEIKQLVRALFQNTERRAALLARIK